MNDHRKAECCACHTNPPCSWCLRPTTECEGCGAEIERDGRVIDLEWNGEPILCDCCEDLVATCRAAGESWFMGTFDSLEGNQ